MFSLFVDTTQDYCNLAILKNAKIVVKSSVRTHNNLTDVVVEHIDSLIEKAKIKQKDIKKILVVIGPGSFTGVRIGTIVAKAWALTNGAKIYQINSLLLQLPKGNGVSLLDAKGNNFYFGMYKNNKPISKPTMIDGTQAESLVKKHRNKDIFIQYKSVDVFDNLVFHLQNFKLVKNIDALTPLYIKEAV